MIPDDFLKQMLGNPPALPSIEFQVCPPPDDPNPILTLAIDPGKCTGWALFYDAYLVDSGIVKGANWEDIGARFPVHVANRNVHYLICEDQFHDRRSNVKVDSLMFLARINGAVFGVVRPSVGVSLVKPRTWKGLVKKRINNQRTLETLIHGERENMNLDQYPESLRNNLLDAVGVGLWFLKEKNYYGKKPR